MYLRKKINYTFFYWMLFLLLGTSCGSQRKALSSAREPSHIQENELESSTTTIQLTEEQQRRYNYYFLEANRLKTQNKYDAAFELLQHCLTINPQASSALFEMSKYYLFLKQQGLGMDYLEKAVIYAPDNFWYSQALVNLYLQQEKTDKAVVLLKQMRHRFPTKLDPVYNLLEIYNRKEQYDDVLTLLNELEEHMGKSEQLSMEKFRIYLQKMDEKHALREIESLVEEYPLELRYKIILGDVYLQRQRNKDALNMYQQVLKEEPDNALALYSMANYYDATGQKEAYQQQLDTLLLNKKVDSDTKLGIMRQFVAQNLQSDSTRIINLFDKIMEQEPDNVQLPLFYAQYLVSKKMEKKAIPVLNQVLDIDPTHAGARMTLLGEAIRSQNYKEVARLCEGGVEANPDILEFYFYLAIAYNQAERTDDAIAISEKALTHVTNESDKELVSDFHSIIGDGYHTKGEIKKAYEAYEKALEVNPKNIGVLNNYAYFLSVERKNLDKAEEMSYKTVKAEPQNATYLDTYAWILFEKGNYAEARIYIDEAMKSKEGSESEVIVEHCGDIYSQLGETDKAVEYWKKALELGNTNQVLKQKIEKRKYIQEHE